MPSAIPLFFVIFLLGLRHGIDWDHIAAITDITNSSGERKQGILLAMFYVLGHAVMIVTLGLFAVLIGINLPPWIDSVMERIVGITLILLGSFVLISIIRKGKEFRFQSRWMILFGLIKKLNHKIHNVFHHTHQDHDIFHHPENYGRRSAFIVGMIHGIGAETPTQVLLFLAVTGAKNNVTGVFLVFSFVAGLIISNGIITVLTAYGFASLQKRSAIYLSLGILTGVFSIIVGLLFLLQKGSLLPAIFTG